MSSNLIVTPNTSTDEHPVSFVHRIVACNGIAPTQPNYESVYEEIKSTAKYGYKRMIELQEIKACLQFRQPPEAKGKLRFAGGLCPLCLKSGSPLRISSGHPYLSVCVKHRVKIHACCPRCYEPSSFSWVFNQRCNHCQFEIVNHILLPCSKTELNAAVILRAWLQTVNMPTRYKISSLNGVSFTDRSWFLTSLVECAIEKKSGGCPLPALKYAEGRRWVLNNILCWQEALLVGLSEITPAPPKGALFIEYLDWLYSAVTNDIARQNSSKILTEEKFEVIAMLLMHDFFKTVDQSKNLERREFTDNDVKISRRDKQVVRLAQEPVALELKVQEQDPVNNKTFHKELKNSISALKKRYCWSSKKPRKTLDAFQLAIQQKTPVKTEKLDSTISLEDLAGCLSQTQLQRVESEIVRGNIRFYKEGHSGNYETDIRLSIEDVGRRECATRAANKNTASIF